MAKDATDDKPITEADLAKLEDTSADFDDDPENPTWADGEEDDEGFPEEKPSKKPDPKRKDPVEEDDSDSDDDSDSEDTKDSEDEDDADSEDEAEDDSADEDSADSKDDDPVTKAIEEERKKHNDEMAKSRIAEKKARDEAAAARAVATESAIDRYVNEAGDDEAERKQRQADVQEFRNREERIAMNDERLQTGVERAVAAIPLFQTKNEVVQEELLSAVDAFENQFVVKDKHGRPLEIKIDPATGKRADLVAYLQRKADSIQKLTGVGATQQDKSKKNQNRRTITPPVKAPKKPKTDPDMDAFDEEANRW